MQNLPLLVALGGTRLKGCSPRGQSDVVTEMFLRCVSPLDSAPAVRVVNSLSYSVDIETVLDAPV